MTRPTTQVDTVVVVDEHTFRPWIAADVPFLWDMLHLALFVPVGAEPLPRSVLDEPKVAHYLRSFGERTGDDAQVCEGSDGPVGAAWCRKLDSTDPGYGYVADEVPELGMAIVGSWRGRGIGRRLLGDLLQRHPAMSLSVDDANTAAVELYRSLGFRPVASAAGSTTMARTQREVPSALLLEQPRPPQTNPDEQDSS
ncbi:MAG: GNAT family N-acetyltransferase [Candidatus Microthrix sp.]|uniref:GNAT family N-acetyltransferase n=1 Tax=Candidatus Neomicrothrix subdominans TaxID=2954438 RepID=A0A936TE44_9ACTN|nr:GNAT family N-acetyltransferase [Candidatus Microthrix subdominans]